MKLYFKYTSIITSVYYYGKFLGLCPFTFNKNNVFKSSNCGKIFNVSISFLYTISFIIVINCRFMLRFSEETNLKILIDTFVITFKYGAVVAFWLTFAFRQNDLKNILQSFESMEKNSCSLSEQCQRKYLRNKWKNISITFLLVNILFFLLLLGEHFTLRQYKNFASQANIWVAYNAPHIVIYNGVFIFIECMIFFKENYRFLNKVLVESICRHQQRCNINFFNDRIIIPKMFQTIGCFHVNVTDALECFTNLFSFSIILVIITVFLQIINDIYLIFQFTKRLEPWKLEDIELFFLIVILVAVRIIFMYFICSIPDSTCREVIYSFLKYN